MDLLKILQEADILSLEAEQSRQNFEGAKAALEKAKSLLDESQNNLNSLLSRSEELGLSRSKLKKLVDERTQALLASGLWTEGASPAPKAPRAPRKKAENAVPNLETEEISNEAMM